MKYIFFLVLTLGSSLLLAEERWDPDAPDVLNFKIGLLGPALDVETSTGKGDNPVNYKPSPYTKTFLGLGYRNLGIYLSTKNPSSEEDTAKYGSSQSTDFQFSFYGTHWTQYYYYQIYKGYYVDNTNEVDPSQLPNTYIRREDLSTIHYGATFIYNFQPERYSIGATFAQNGRQKESGGAWLASVGLHDHRFSGSQDILPPTVASKYGELATLESGDIREVSLGGGGGYTWTGWDGYYAGIQVLVGLGISYANFETAEAYYRRWTLGSVSNAMISFGYNGKNNYLVITSGTDNSYYDLKDLKLAMNTRMYSFHYGHRFEGVDIPFLNTISGWFD
jgi:hypothetical protein